MKTLAPVLLQFLAGLVFGVGLIIAGMADPAKVLNFLDLGAIPHGGWDPSLAFVMVGAIAVTFIGYRLVWRQPQPLFNGRFQLPTLTTIDRPLVAGSALFGLGWGLSGFCPGPAFTALIPGFPAVVPFFLAMLVGICCGPRLREAAGRSGR